MSKNKYVIYNRHKNNTLQKQNNNLFLSDYEKSRNNKTITLTKTITNISSIQLIKNKKKNNNKSNISLLNVNQRNRNYNYIQPSTIEKYTKSLYYYCKLNNTRKYFHRQMNLEPSQMMKKNTENCLDNDCNRKITRIESTCETLNNSNKKKNKNRKNINDSSSKIINRKNQVQLKGNNKNHHHSCDLFNPKIIKNRDIIKKKVIKIQLYFRGYLVRKKIKKKLKIKTQFSKGINVLNSLLLIYNKNIFLKLKNKYIHEKMNDKNNIFLNPDNSGKNEYIKYNNEICNNISISIKQYKYIENNKTEKEINNNNLTRDNKINFDSKIIKNCNKINIDDSTNTSSNKNENKNIEIKNNILLDELNNDFQNAINEKKILQEKLDETNKNYNKLKEKIKEFENAKIKYHNIKKENEQIKQKDDEILKQNEQLLKEIQLIKDNYNKLLEEQQKQRKKDDINNNQRIKKNNSNNSDSDSITNTINSEDNINNKKVNLNINISSSDSEDEELSSPKKIKKVAFNFSNNPYIRSESASIVRRKSLLKNRIQNSLNQTNLTQIKEVFTFESDSESKKSNDSNNTIEEELKRKEKEQKEKEDKEKEEKGEKDKDKDLDFDRKNLKIKKLKVLFRKKELKMKEYLKNYFAKFYYNGIYFKMTGRLPTRTRNRSQSVIYTPKTNTSLVYTLNNYNKNNNKGNININKNNNLNNKKDENNDNKENKNSDNSKAEEQNKAIRDEMVQKARGLRKLLSRRGKEKNEKLRKYFHKFYQAGIMKKVRSIRRLTSKIIEGKNSQLLLFKKNDNIQNDNSISRNRYNNNYLNNFFSNKNILSKSENKENNYNVEIKDLDEDLNNFLKKSKSAIIKFDEEKKAQKEKVKEKLRILFYKADRLNTKIKRNIFQKYYLRTKLESIENISGKIKKKKSKRKKSKKKSIIGKIKEEEKEIEKEDNKEENKKGESSEIIKEE